MSRTIEAILAHMIPPTKPHVEPTRIGKLIAEWQEGLGAGMHAQRKLRLSLSNNAGDRVPFPTRLARS